jgi:hypothetical protein
VLVKEILRRVSRYFCEQYCPKCGQKIWTTSAILQKKPSTNIYHSMVFQNIPIFVIFVMKIFHLATLIESALKC